MKESGRSLPMWATGFHAHPWNQQSVLLIGNLLSFGGLVVGQQQNERILLELIHAGVADDKLRELFEPLLDHADFDLLREDQNPESALERSAGADDRSAPAGRQQCLGRGPQRSAHRLALLAWDPHLEVNRLPAIWYEAVLDWDRRLR